MSRDAEQAKVARLQTGDLPDGLAGAPFTDTDQLAEWRHADIHGAIPGDRHALGELPGRPIRRKDELGRPDCGDGDR